MTLLLTDSEDSKDFEDSSDLAAPSLDFENSSDLASRGGVHCPVPVRVSDCVRRVPSALAIIKGLKGRKGLKGPTDHQKERPKRAKRPERH